jgi:hypothetical protein
MVVAEMNGPGNEGDSNKKISLAMLSEMTGFPMELIQQELFLGKAEGGEVALEDLRAAMLNFIDATILEETK